MFGSRTRWSGAGRREPRRSTLGSGTLALPINFRVPGPVPCRLADVTGIARTESRPSAAQSLDFMFSL